MPKMNFLEASDVVKSKRGSRTKRQKYSKYSEGLAPFLKQIKQGIENDPDGKVVVKSEEIATHLGMVGRHPTTIYWGTKFAMWQEGIAVDSGTHKDKSSLLVFRNPEPGEKLPDSLIKYEETEEGEEPEPEDEEEPEDNEFEDELQDLD